MKTIIYFLFLFMVLLNTSCSGVDQPYLGPVNTIHYEMEDSILSGDYHEFTLSIVGEYLPKDWNLNVLEVCSLKEIPNDSSTQIRIDWHTPEDYFCDGNSFGTDWISFEKQLTSTSPKLKISIKKNDSDMARGVYLEFYNYEDRRFNPNYGYIIIYQKPMPDMEPFTMKIRYKGIQYTTEAHLNINEEIEYSDSEFSRIMKEIDALADVEAVVLEDDIVDYFDMSDHRVSKAIRRLRETIDSSTRCDIRDDLCSTRDLDPYRFMVADAIGYFAMFDDTGWKDTKVCANLKDLYDVNDEEYMRNIGLNDKVSSLAVAYNGTNSEICSVLTVWEDSYYNNGDNDRTKHRISIIATKQNPKVSFSNLKKIKCINSSNSWNDRISSYSFAFGNYDHYLKDY
ncbi:MAG: hypothetical protein HDR88_01885 [Bacteroides sp.]|nr:hypothetical protein [Bacteroides sp.]